MTADQTAGDEQDLISPAQLERVEQILSRRIIRALEGTRVAQYIGNGHIELIVVNGVFKPSVRLTRETRPAGDK